MEQMVLSIRKAIVDDIDDIISMMAIFAQEIGDAPYATDRDFLIKQGLERDDTFDILVAASDEHVIGYVVTTPSYNPKNGTLGLFIEDFYVRKEARNLGIGLVLIRETAKRSAEFGGAFLRWDVDLENLHAIEFYQKTGAEREPENTLMQLYGDSFKQFIRTQ